VHFICIVCNNCISIGSEKFKKKFEFASDSFSNVEGQVTGSCKRGNEPSVSIKRGEFLDWLRTG